MLVDPGGQLMPAPHGRHVPDEVEPKESEKNPPGQFTHEVAPVAETYVPCGQLRHAERPAVGA